MAQKKSYCYKLTFSTAPKSTDSKKVNSQYLDRLVQFFIRVLRPAHLFSQHHQLMLVLMPYRFEKCLHAFCIHLFNRWRILFLRMVFIENWRTYIFLKIFSWARGTRGASWQKRPGSNCFLAHRKIKFYHRMTAMRHMINRLQRAAFD